MKQNNSGNKQSTDLILILIGCYLSVISVKLRIAKFLLLKIITRDRWSWEWRAVTVFTQTNLALQVYLNFAKE